MKILETERTILRTFHNDDLQDLCDMHMNPDAMKYLVGGARSNRDAVRRDLEQYLHMQATDGLSKWAVIEKQTQRFMGRAGLIKISETDEIDLGYAFHPNFWNKGFGTEVAKALLNLAEERGIIEKTLALVLAQNTASVQVLKKIGMKFTGVGNYFGVVGFHVYRP